MPAHYTQAHYALRKSNESMYNVICKGELHAEYVAELLVQNGTAGGLATPAKHKYCDL